MNNLEITNSTIKMTNPYRRNNLIGWKLTLPMMTHSINGKIMTHSIFSNTIFLPEQRQFLSSAEKLYEIRNGNSQNDVLGDF